MSNVLMCYASRSLVYGALLNLLFVPIGANATGEPDLAGKSADVQDERNDIDWEGIELWDHIPHSLASTISDKAIDAGFSGEWIRRSLRGEYASSVRLHPLNSVRGDTLALYIISKDRRPDDLWAHEVGQLLRDEVEKHADDYTKRYLRVFCNEVGCLCYVEGLDPKSVGVVLSDVRHGAVAEDAWGKQFGISEDVTFQIGLITPGSVRAARDPTIWRIFYILRSPIQ